MKNECIADCKLENTGFNYTMSLIQGKYKMVILYTLMEFQTVRGVTFDKMKDFPEGNDLGPWDPKNFDVEDTAMAMITMKNGAMFYVETAWISNMQQEAPGIIASIAGTKAGVDMVGPGFEDSVRVTKMVDGKLTTETISPAEKYNMWEYDMDRWIDCIIRGTEPAVLPEQAATVTRVIEAIYKSAETGETIVFD